MVTHSARAVTEDEAFQQYFFTWLFDRYRARVLEEETA